MHRHTGGRCVQSRCTTTSAGLLLFHAFGALAEFERDLSREQTLAGLRVTPTAAWECHE